MVVSNKGETQLTVNEFVDVYEQLRRIEEKLRRAYPEAEFRLVCGPDSTLQLFVWTDAADLWAPMDLIKDEQDALLSQHDVSLYVVPARLSTRAADGF